MTFKGVYKKKNSVNIWALMRLSSEKKIAMYISTYVYTYIFSLPFCN